MYPGNELSGEDWEQSPDARVEEMPFLVACYVTIGHICVVMVTEVRGHHSGRTAGLLQALPLGLIVLWRGKTCSWILIFL